MAAGEAGDVEERRVEGGEEGAIIAVYGQGALASRGRSTGVGKGEVEGNVGFQTGWSKSARAVLGGELPGLTQTLTNRGGGY